MVYRLRQMMIEPRGFGPLHIFELAPARYGDEFDLCTPWLCTDSLRYVISVQFRHPNVEKHHFGSRRGGELKRLLAVVCTEHLVAIKVQKDLETLDGILIVIGHHYLARFLSAIRLMFLAGFHRMLHRGLRDGEADGEFAAPP